MRIQNKKFKAVVFLFSLTFCQAVFGWGEPGHRIIAHVGSLLTNTPSPFWKANDAGMVQLTTVPDLVWKSLPTARIEKPTHFFQPDSYVADPSGFGQIPHAYSQAVAKFGQKFVDSNGTSIWRVQQFYNVGVAALRQGNYQVALQAAGVMSHYIGDLAQPLHDTKNFDGQLTKQPGIHLFFESANIAAADQGKVVDAVGNATAALLKDPNFLKYFNGSISDIVFYEAYRAYGYKDVLLKIDKTEGRRGQGAVDLLKLAILRMADGAGTLALVLDKMWADAGNPTGGSTIKVPTPTWLAPKYDGLMVSAGDGGLSSSIEPLADDCY